MKLAEAYVEIETNQAKFGKELKTMESAVKKSTDRMKKNFDRIGQGVSQISSTARIGFLAMSAAIVGSVYAFTKMGDEIHKMSIRTGVAATELSALGYAAQISGAELNTVEKSLRYLSARMMDAKTGLAEAVRAFDELGISITDTEGNLRPTVDVLIEASDKIAAMTNETEKSALAAEIFGMRFGPMLLPLLNEGSEGITKLMDKAKELGITIDTEAAAAAAEFNDRLTDMKGVLAALGREVGEVFLPVFRNTVVIIIDKVKEWRKAIDALTPQQKKLIAQVVLLGTAALGAVGALGLFAKLAVLVKAAGLIIMGVCGLIASPLGLIMLAVGALAVAWTYNWGDIQGKVETVWKVLEPIFQKMWDWISKAWNWIIEIGGEAWEWIKETAYPKLMEWLDKAWIWTANIAGKAWGWLSETAYPKLMEWLSKAWDWTVEISGKAWEWLSKTAYPFLMEQLSKAWDWTVDVTGKAWEWLSKTAYPFLMDELSKAWAWTVNVAGEAWRWIKETAYPFLMEKLREAWTWTADIAGKAWDWLSETAYPFLMEQLSKAWTWTAGIVGKAWDWLSLTAYPKFMEWLSRAWEWTVNLAGDAWDWVKEELWPRLNEYAIKAWSWSMEKLSGTWVWIRDTLWPKLSEYATKAWNWSMILVGKTWSWIKDELWPALGKVVRVTVEFFQKLISPPEGAEEQGEGWAGKFWKGFTEYLEKIEKTIELKVLFIWDLVTIVGSFFKGFWEGLTKEFEADTTNPLEIAKIIGRGIIDGLKAYIDAELELWIWIRDAVEEHLEEWKSIGEYIGEKIGEAIRATLGWWFKGFDVPEAFKPISEGAKDTEEALAGVITKVKTLEKDLSHLTPYISGLKLQLEDASKGWTTFTQVAKRQVAAAAATFILFEKEVTDIGAKAPLEFAEKFEKAFMKAKPDIQKAILDALISGDLERALSLAGVKAGRAFLGTSPGMLTELEAGTKDIEKELGKMLDSMDEMTKKMMKIFEPIIGLFKKMFEGITDAMIKSENETISQMGKDLKGFVDMVFAMMMGLFDAIEGEADDLPDKMKPGLDKTKSLWQKFCDIVGNLWKSICEAVKASFSDAMVAIIAGTQTVAEAFKALQKAIAVELAKIAVKAAAAGDAVTAVVAGVAAAFTAFGIRIRETTTHFETAWGTIGRSMYFVQIEVGKLGEHLKEAGELMYGLKGTTIDLGDAAAYVEREFAKVGLAISESLGQAKTKLEELYTAQVDLASSTREKLIAELDNYYDYRVLKEMTLSELLELSAKTRLEIEQGTIAKVDESEAEQEARRRDRAISRLQQIEEGYAKEDELLRRKIALTEIEIKFLELKMEREAHGHSQRAKQLEEELGDMLEAYHTGVEAYEDAERRKQAATDETRETVEEANEEMRDSTEVAAEAMEDAMRGTAEAIEDAAEDMATAIETATGDMVKAIGVMSNDIVRAMEDMTRDIVSAITDMVTKINEKLAEIPEEIEFDVTGILHMPTIPSIGTQYFDIFGRYNAPSAQIGIPNIPRPMLVRVHPEEAILNPRQAREWRAGRGGEGGVTQFGDIVMHAEFPNIDLETLTSEKIERLFRKKFVPAIKEAVRLGLFSRDLVGVRRVK